MKKTIVEHKGKKYVITIKPHSAEKTNVVPRSLLERIWNIDESNDLVAPEYKRGKGMRK